MNSIEFLSFDDVLVIHADQLKQFGGQAGFIDRTVIESAVAMPRQAMFGKYLHDGIPSMAAAYLFHLGAAQGFVDGNKRTALASAIEFLARNGYTLECSDREIYELTMRVANHQAEKEVIADWIRDRLSPLA